MQVFNTFTQKLEDVTWSADDNHEIIATFADGHFVKFPAGTTKEQLTELVDKHALSNEGKVIVTPEMEAAIEAQNKASQDLVDELNA